MTMTLGARRTLMRKVAEGNIDRLALGGMRCHSKIAAEVSVEKKLRRYSRCTDASSIAIRIVCA